MQDTEADRHSVRTVILQAGNDLLIAQLFWDFTQGATSFTALAATQQSLNTTCPETSDTNCALSGTQCGQIYNITVTAPNSACNGTGTATSDPYQLMTGQSHDIACR